jgi:hypothetical protein
MKYLALLAFIFTVNANAQTCAGPAPCDYQPPCFGPGGCQPPAEPVGPAELCLPDGCTPVVYEWQDAFMTATSALPNGYPVRGTAGPCLKEYCPNIGFQAFGKLLSNALDADRAQRY